MKMKEATPLQLTGEPAERVFPKKKANETFEDAFLSLLSSLPHQFSTVPPIPVVQSG